MASDKKKAKQLAHDLLKRRAAGETPKSQLSSQLLDLIEKFFDEIGYTKSYKALKVDREKYSDGTKDKLPNSSSLAAFFNEWQISKSTKIPEVEDKKTKQNKKDLKKTLKKNSLNSEDAISSKSRNSRICSGSDDDLSDVSTNGGASLQNRTSIKNVNTKKRKASTSSSSSDSDSSSDSPAPKRKKNKIMARDDVISKSSSESSSSSDSTSDDTGSSSSDSSSSDSNSQDTVSLPKIMALLEKSDSSTDSDSSDSTSSDDSSSSNDSSDSSDSDGSDGSDGSDDPSSSSDSSDSNSSVPKKSGKKVLSKTSKKTLKKDSKDKLTIKKSSTTRSKSKETPVKAENSIPKAVSSVKRERKTKEPFSRIPKDIKVDKKLASNAYVPYDYAQKAHEDLIVTKGKGFTKEKNKKKRGSYRGGHIDVDGKNGIKFED